MESSLIRVEHLKTSFQTPHGMIYPVNDVSFAINTSETIGLVGESGCGKSMTALSLLNLIPSPPGNIESGKIFFKDKDLLQLSREELRQIRGNDMSMIFQEPMTSLNPVFSIGNQLNEVFITHQNLSKKNATERSIELLKMVNIPNPEKKIDEYPHQLSGGMRQRVMIAMALACQPSLLIADEPTTALDVTIQAQILDLMSELQDKFSMSIMVITHDLGVLAQICESVMVMYAGHIVEKAPTKALFESPKHPYTQGLLKSIPKLGKKEKKLSTIEGHVPSLHSLPSGCKFHNRCPKAMDICRIKEPEAIKISSHEEVKCWLYNK